MNEAEKRNPGAPALDEAEVAAYLQAHPDLLGRYPAVLEALEVHHDAGAAVSLIERQVTGLRNTNRQLQSRFTELVDTARDNEQRVVQLNRLAKTLVGAETASQAVTDLGYCLQQDLDVDYIYIGVQDSSADVEAATQSKVRAIVADTPADRALTNVFRRGKPICGPLSDDQSEALFATRSHDQPALASAAMIPLGTRGVHGALVLASRKGTRFVPDMGTMFLELMGELVTAAFQRLLGRELLP